MNQLAIPFICMVLAVPQAISAILEISEWLKKRKDSEGAVSSGRKVLAVFLVLGTFGMGALAVWTYYHPFGNPPTIVNAPRPPAQQTGDASTNGNQSPAITGNDNSVGIETPPPSTQKKPKPVSK
jgi:hypothetical protein